MAERYEQYAFGDGEDGEQALVPMKREKLRPRGITSVDKMEAFHGSDYPEFLKKVMHIGMSVSTRRNRTAEEMKNGLLQYLELCEQYNKPITNQACYMAMGINDSMAYNITHGRSGTEEQKQIVLYAKQLCAMNREALGITGTVDAILTIFWQKAYDGLNEMTEVNAGLDMNDSIIEANADEIAEKYSDLPD